MLRRVENVIVHGIACVCALIMFLTSKAEKKSSREIGFF